MTPEDLKTLINGDATASAFAVALNDIECAARCSEIAPKILQKTQLSEMGILELYVDDPAAGQAVLTQMESVAQSNPLVARIVRFMGPGVHPSMLPDWSLPSIRAALTAPVEAGGIGLTNEQAAPILAAAEIAQVISSQEVSVAMSSTREMFRREDKAEDGTITVTVFREVTDEDGNTVLEAAQ